MNFEEKIISLHKELGIPDSYRRDRGLPLQMEATDLVESETDVFARKQRMTSETFRCWTQMKQAAFADKVELLLVSAFRSVEYQTNIIKTKLEKGQSIEDILKVNAAPGFSEHHSGRALDLGTVNCEPLTEAFETTDAFHWLSEHAGEYSFSMTYPRDNPYQIDYEPWHWACRE